MRRILILIISILLVNLAFNQSITNVISKLEGQKIAVTYNLQSDNPVGISLFISEDGGKTFTGPLKHISGDIGLTQSGTNKKIIWDVLKERKILHGNNIVFRVKAQINIRKSSLEVPNVFTPDNDDINYYFQVKAVSLRTFEGYIYNRWGELVYEWSNWQDLEAGWDGTLDRGTKATPDQYLYTIKAEGLDGQSYFVKGIINLLE